jgi:hypothetical protein
MTVVCCQWRAKARRRSGYESAGGLNDLAIDLSKLPSNMSYHCTEIKLNPKLESLEYPRNDIIYIRDIGQGAFGRVFQVRNSIKIIYVKASRSLICMLDGYFRRSRFLSRTFLF